MLLDDVSDVRVCRSRRTYSKPVAQSRLMAIFFARGIFNFHNDETGRSMMTTSDTMLNML